MSATCRVVPFGNPRVSGHLHLDGAYRSLSRPSSPPRAQASTMCPFLLPVMFCLIASLSGGKADIYFQLSCSTLNFVCRNMSMIDSFIRAGRFPEEARRPYLVSHTESSTERRVFNANLFLGTDHGTTLQKGGVPAAPSGTATLLRLSPNHQFHPRPILAVTDFRCPRLSWLDGRCVQGPGTYSPRHG